MRDKEQIIKESPLFEGIEGATRDRMSENLHRRTARAGTLIMASDQPSSVVSIIVEGTAKICVSRNGRDTILNLIGPGEVLGEMAVLDGQGHSADVITLEDMTLLWMDKDEFAGYLKTVPELGINIARALSRRLRLATARIDALSTMDVPGRVAHQLRVFSNEYGRKNTAGEVVIPLYLTQSDLAELVGATRTRVNQAIASLRKTQVISIDKNHHITIHDPIALARRCQ